MTFSFDISNIIAGKSPSPKQQPIGKITKATDSHLLCETRFCQEADFTVRTFGNYMYATDSAMGNLHVYSIKDKQWNYSRLDELGIN